MNPHFKSYSVYEIPGKVMSSNDFSHWDDIRVANCMDGLKWYSLSGCRDSNLVGHVIQKRKREK